MLKLSIEEFSVHMQSLSLSVLIVDSNIDYVRFLRSAFKEQDMRLLGVAHDLESAILKCAEQSPDIVVLDPTIGGVNFQEFFQSFSAKFAASKCIIFSKIFCKNPDFVTEFLMKDVLAVIEKPEISALEENAKSIVSQIHRICEDESLKKRL